MIPEPRLIGLKSTLERSKSAVLVCHQKPDGDAIGSTVGLGLALEQLGARVQYVCKDPIPEHYRFLARAERFQQTLPASDVDLVVLLDCPNDSKTGFDTPELSKLAPIVDIDHHQKQGSPPSPRLAVYDTAASSVAEMVFETIAFAGWKVTRDTATSLLTGLISDTSAFQNGNTSSRVLEVAGVLLSRGADHKSVIRHCFYTSSIPKLKLWGIAMSRIEQNSHAAGIVSTVVTAEDIRECGAHPDDLEGLVNFLNAIPGVPALMLLTDLGKGEVKGSLRTRNQQIDVDALARTLGGGGHRQAAGFSVPGRLVQSPGHAWKITSS